MRLPCYIGDFTIFQTLTNKVVMIDPKAYRRYTYQLEAATSLLEHKLRVFNTAIPTNETLLYLELAQSLLDRLKELRIYISSVYGQGLAATASIYKKSIIQVEKIIERVSNIDDEINALINGVNTLKL